VRDVVRTSTAEARRSGASRIIDSWAKDATSRAVLGPDVAAAEALPPLRIGLCCR